MAMLKDIPGITLTSAGAGEEIDHCKAEAARLGILDRVTFLGRIAREKVEELYASHDVFCFPSFREPAGGVLYEAMRHGLPIVTADRGGPSWIVDASSGLYASILYDDAQLPISTHDKDNVIYCIQASSSFRDNRFFKYAVPHFRHPGDHFDITANHIARRSLRKDRSPTTISGPRKPFPQ